MENIIELDKRPHKRSLLQRSPVPPPAPLLQPGQARILIIEDNIVGQKIVVRMLEKSGHLCDVVNNGVEALGALERSSYDIVLMGYHLPEMDGCESARQICEKEQDGKHTPIIAMTSNATSEDNKRCLEAGMDDFISRPFSKQQLINTLVRYLPDLVA